MSNNTEFRAQDSVEVTKLTDIFVTKTLKNILFYMYFMLIVTSKILMHTIKSLKNNQVLIKNILVYFYAKMLKICTFILVF